MFPFVDSLYYVRWGAATALAGTAQELIQVSIGQKTRLTGWPSSGAERPVPNRDEPADAEIADRYAAIVSRLTKAETRCRRSSLRALPSDVI